MTKLEIRVYRRNTKGRLVRAIRWVENRASALPIYKQQFLTIFKQLAEQEDPKHFYKWKRCVAYRIRELRDNKKPASWSKLPLYDLPNVFEETISDDELADVGV